MGAQPKRIEVTSDNELPAPARLQESVGLPHDDSNYPTIADTVSRARKRGKASKTSWSDYER